MMDLLLEVVPGLFFVLIIAILFMIALYFIAGLILRIAGGKRKERAMKNVGRVFLIIAVLHVAVAVGIFMWFIYKATHRDVTLENGQTVTIGTDDVADVREYVKNHQNDKLVELLESTPGLAEYRDSERNDLLTYGMIYRNVEAMELAVEYGFEFDNPDKYRNKKVDAINSFDCYFREIKDAETSLLYDDEAPEHLINEDDVEVVKFMLEHGASTKTEDEAYIGYDYTEVKEPNLLYLAVWTVISQENSISDADIEFVRAFIDYGFSKNVATYYGNDLYTTTIERIEEYENKGNTIEKDDNFYELMELIK